MQEAYCETVAVQVLGTSPQPRLEKAPASDCRQEFSARLQPVRNWSVVIELLDAARYRPFHLHAVACGIAVPK
jgi:hypothetical protein